VDGPDAPQPTHAVVEYEIAEHDRGDAAVMTMNPETPMVQAGQ
jgi:hypothetical protein